LLGGSCRPQRVVIATSSWSRSGGRVVIGFATRGGAHEHAQPGSVDVLPPEDDLVAQSPRSGDEPRCATRSRTEDARAPAGHRVDEDCDHHHRFSKKLCRSERRGAEMLRGSGRQPTVVPYAAIFGIGSSGYWNHLDCLQSRSPTGTRIEKRGARRALDDRERAVGECVSEFPRPRRQHDEDALNRGPRRLPPASASQETMLLLGICGWPTT